MNRGDIWLAEVGRKARPVVVLTRSEVIDVRLLVTVAEVTTVPRGLAVEVPIDASCGIDQESAINCDAVHTIQQSALTRRIGSVSDDVMQSVCRAIAVAFGC